MTSVDVLGITQRYQDALAAADDDNFETVLSGLRKEVMGNERNVIEQLRSNLVAESDVALNVKGVERAELALGCALALSEARSDNFEATKLLQGMIDQNSSQTDLCYFWVAIARFHLGEFREARLWCEKLLLRHPDNVLPRKLLARIRYRVRRDGLSGLGIIVAVAVISAVAGNLFGRLRSTA